MNFLKIVLISLILVLVVPSLARATELTIATFYLGMEDNEYSNPDYGITLEDSQFMKGLYLQQINTEKYQWNAFLYYTADINQSDLWGLNFVYDYYFGVSASAKNVVGIGLNHFQLDLAGQDLPSASGTLDSFELDLAISSPYLRVGRYFIFENQAHWTLLPWIGGQLDYSRGRGRVDFPGPGAADFVIDQTEYYWITGLNLRLAYHHFLEVETKYALTFNQDESYHRWQLMLNLFCSRTAGVSYRFTQHQTPVGADRYQMLGLSLLF